MAGFVTDIEEKTLNNGNFRTVLFTTSRSQLVVMSLRPEEDIGSEVHTDVDQFIRIEAGEGKAVLNGEEYPLKDGSAVVIPAGVEHNIINTSNKEDLKLYTIYTPPEHKDGTVHKTKADAMAAEHEH
jgi:mannose-6-phosphate isomerase-like protein (cupin superfamily)